MLLVTIHQNLSHFFTISSIYIKLLNLILNSFWISWRSWLLQPFTRSSFLGESTWRSSLPFELCLSVYSFVTFLLCFFLLPFPSPPCIQHVISWNFVALRPLRTLLYCMVQCVFYVITSCSMRSWFPLYYCRQCCRTIAAKLVYFK